MCRLFYVSFARRAARRWRGAGFDQPGTLLDSLRGRFALSANGRLEPIVPPRWWRTLTAAAAWVGRLAAAAHTLAREAPSRIVTLCWRSLVWTLSGRTHTTAESHFALLRRCGSLEIRAPARGAAGTIRRSAHMKPMCQRGSWPQSPMSPTSRLDPLLSPCAIRCLAVPRLACLGLRLRHCGAEACALLFVCGPGAVHWRRVFIPTTR